ncbi:MAG: stalk domain-containing protein, partial [Clostridia bacterium]|nr:stalk domain-containing protein [Clostridia bacterium]
WSRGLGDVYKRQVWAWGDNSNGQLGNGNDLACNTPTRVYEIADVVGIDGGAQHSLAIRSDGTLTAWGSNLYGQLGDSAVVISSKPVQSLAYTPNRNPASKDIKVFLDGKLLSFDVPPTIESGRTLVPFSGIFLAFGAKVRWDGPTRTVTGTKIDTKIVLQINNKVAQIGDKKIELDVPAKIKNSRTLVPLAFISQSLGAKVEWDGNTRTILITSE